MQLIINGEATETPQLGSVADLARWLELPAFGSSIELNGNVVRKSDHPNTLLKAGDRLEIVRLVGGG